jgi:hypothetical protein
LARGYFGTEPESLTIDLKRHEDKTTSGDFEKLASLQFAPMKRYLAIFLLVLLPLQFSWAAIASYCEHETAVAAEHLGHHTHDHGSADHQESSKKTAQSAGMDHDCATCHLGCAAALVSDLNTTTLATDNVHPLLLQVIVSQLSRERPERPQWPVLA